MSDFDDVLERLLTDPGFQARLAADPAGALAGYQLSADELELLQAQVGGADAGQSRVEQRTSKASMFGLFSSIGSGIGDVVHGHGGGPSFDHGAGHNLGDGGQGSGAAHSAARGLDALEQSGGRHAAPEPEQHGGLAAHLRDAIDHGAHASAGGAEAHAGPGGAYASAGGVEAQAGYGGAGLAEAPDPQGGGYDGLSEASDDPRSYASAGYGGGQDGGYGSLSEASDDPRSYASAGYGGGQDGGYGGLSEAPDPQGSEGLAEASPYGVSEVHSSGQGTVYRSASAGIGEAVGQGAHAGTGHAEAGFGGAHAEAGLGGAHAEAGFTEAHAQADGGGRHGIAGGLDGIVGGQQPGHGSGTGVAGGVAGALRDGVPGGVGQAPTDGYHTRVDWDGDGRWDQHTYVNRADGGVDIVVDTDGDGRAEFVGHDTDRDGLINSSEIDTNRDGVMDQRYEDLNGDGWLDRRTR
ncbi:hypothetical protein [Dactylosporangium sp. NPDC050588]|uniref:hypothetical protein n=1 Tax=Dactylosporangium sp. NPDC050588 TaxID=3157211 RepID=UPI00340794AE